MDAQGVSPGASPSGDVPVARWRAVAIHHKPLLVGAWVSASALAFAPMPGFYRALWVAVVTVAFGLMALLRWRTETRAEVLVTRTHAVVRYRSGHVERLPLAALTEAERVTMPHPRWVFRFGREGRLALPDERDARTLVEALRARLPSRQG